MRSVVFDHVGMQTLNSCDRSRTPFFSSIDFVSSTPWFTINHIIWIIHIHAVPWPIIKIRHGPEPVIKQVLRTRSPDQKAADA